MFPLENSSYDFLSTSSFLNQGNDPSSDEIIQLWMGHNRKNEATLPSISIGRNQGLELISTSLKGKHCLRSTRIWRVLLLEGYFLNSMYFASTPELNIDVEIILCY